MPSFPFFRLPLLVQILILKHVDLLQLFEFSLCSNRTKRIAELLDDTLEKLHSMFDDSSNRHQEYLDRVSALSFPFCRLDVSVQRLILKHVNLLELFDFSLLSKHSRSLVKSLKVNVSHFYWVFDRDPVQRQLHLRSPNEQPFLITFVNMNNTPGCQKLVFKGFDLSVGRCRLDEGSGVGIDNSRLSESDQLELMDRFTEHLLDIFNINGFTVAFDKFPNICGSFIWKYTRNFVQIQVTGDSTKESLSIEEIKFIMEELTVRNLELWLPVVEKGYKYSRLLKMKKLLTRNPHWLTLDAILNMDCESFITEKMCCTEKEMDMILQEFVRKRIVQFEVNDFLPVPEDSERQETEKIKLDEPNE